MFSFSKTLIKTSVSLPWQLPLPAKFRAHYPCQKEYVILVDENEREYSVMYLIKRCLRQRFLGHGWRDFVIAKGLLEGDKVSFHLINRGKFKVYITRADRITENEFHNIVPEGSGNSKDLVEDNTCSGNTVPKNCAVSCAIGGHELEKQKVENMSSEKVSFSRTINKMSVSKYPWLCLPWKFRAHYPCQNEYVILVDENGREYSVRFLIQQFKLGLGWREFVIAQGLLEGDKVSFHLINRGKFKVYITRADRFTENEFHNIVTEGSGKSKDLADTCSGNTVTKKCVVSCAIGGHQTDGMPRQNKKRVHGEMLSREKVIIGSPHRSKGTNGADGDSYVDFHDRSIYDEHRKIVVKELPEVDISHETLVESDDNSIPLEGKRNSPTEENTWTGNTVTKKNPVSCAVDSHQLMKDRMLCSIKKKVHEIEMLVSKQKVYIKSRNKSTGTKGADGSLVNFHECPNVDESPKIVKKEIPVVCISDESDDDSTPQEGQSVGGENSESALRFTAFEDFKIDVNGELLDSEIPSDVRMKYYELCCGQKKFMHDGVAKGIDSKFAVSVILEIVRIADSSNAANISTAPHILEYMGKTLKFYHEDLGFAVESLRAKLGKLTEFSSEYQALVEKAKSGLTR